MGLGRILGGIATFGGSELARGGKKLVGAYNKQPPLNKVLDEANRVAAEKALGQRTFLQDQQSRLLSGQESALGDQRALLSPLQQQLAQLQASDPTQGANAEIERRRRALGTGQQTAVRDVERNIARRGLGNSAAALAARSRALEPFQTQAQDIEGSRFDVENQLRNQQLQRQNQLLGNIGGVYGLTGNTIGSIGGIASQVQQPEIDFAKKKTGLQKFVSGLGGFLGDRIKAGEQIAGSMAGSAGGAAGMFSSQAFKDHIEEVEADELLKAVNDMKVRKYNYTDETMQSLYVSKDRIGVIAEDMAEPYVDKGHQIVDVYNIVFSLLGAVQALTKKVEALENAVH